MSEEMDLSEKLEDIDEELNEENNQIETKIIFKDKPKSDRQISEEDLYSVYQSFDLNFDQLNRKYSHWRLEVIHIRGVESMSSEDVLKYFEDFEPNSIEWVNDLSCNVVFSDRNASAIAMRALTSALVIKTGKHDVNCDLGIDVIDSDSLSVPVPPGFRWRLGVTHHKSKALLLRFATNSDKKIRGSRGMSQYYAKHGVPLNSGSNSWANERKRHYIEEEAEEEAIQDIDESPIELKTKRLRMRMRADDEQDLMRKRLIHRISDKPALSSALSQRKSIWERLDNDSFGNYCAVDPELLQIAFDNRTNSRKSVWKEQPMRSSISVVKSHTNDLRTKIRKRKSY